MIDSAEQQRLIGYRERRSNWKHWGPYLAERAWGTVREDYSANGDAWGYFPHDHARSRVYRWNEDGLAGICDRFQNLCFALALWNGQDPILKERLFGLTGPEGNHGEDVKEYYFYLDSTPTHSYMKMLYKYPHAAFPYADLVRENGRRGHLDQEYELLDTGIFAESRYFDVLVEYAKADQDDILIRITITNRGSARAQCHLLPTLWFRNTWRWGYADGPLGETAQKPLLQLGTAQADAIQLQAHHPALGDYALHAEAGTAVLFTENETNNERLFGTANATPFVKDAFHRYLVNGEETAINPAQEGTKAAIHYVAGLAAGETVTYRLRLTNDPAITDIGEDFAAIFAQRIAEADEFYATIQCADLSAEDQAIQRQAFAGMLWNKQIYYYDIAQWLAGDPAMPTPPAERRNGRNNDWEHLHNFDIISMPDKWEYPWYATWDLAFHCIALAQIDPDFAKRQLELFTREWYMHPNGALPAYEWAFDDANPPVHAWATWRVYKIAGKREGGADRAWLEGIFHKLLLNFTWWVNRKDEDGHNVFQGGFLGLDNISVFDRSSIPTDGGHLDQSDATAWMGFYSLMMLKIALELARKEPIYQDTATKFYEHFLRIASAMSGYGSVRESLWDEQDGFFYDVIHFRDGQDDMLPLRVRSLVGLLPLIAVETLEPELLAQMPDFDRRMHWFVQNRPHLVDNMASIDVQGEGQRYLFAILTEERLRRVLQYLLDETEFLAPHGIRSLSKIHAQHPYSITLQGKTFTIDYEPGESRTGLFGGNSNWRGPIWFPINYLIIEGLQRFHHYYGDDFTVECPTGSGRMMTLADVAGELAQRLINLFRRDETGQRPIYDGQPVFQEDPHWRDHLLFYEYFHGDTGAGLGAGHQTGWTGLVAKLLQQIGGDRS
ncbi:MAG: hypothetical protein KDE19_03565 [Caldilineaceae bacterium]|nr:hypothetical protein [Caldilineaceae bacterium]